MADSPEPHLWTKIDPVRFVCIGGALVAVSDFLMYPAIVLKTNIQADRSKQSLSLSGTVELAKKMWRNTGFRGLFRGFGAFSAGGMPSYGAYFAGYNIAKEAAFSARDAYAPRVPDAALYFFSGIVADVTAMPLWVPVDVVMQRMALQNVGGGRRYSSYKDAVQTIRAEEGLRGFYKGIGATVWTYAPSSAVWWAVYETVLPLLHRARGNKSGANDHLVHGAGGFLAGASAAASTHPLDVVKTRLQTSAYVAGADSSVFRNVRALYKAEGFAALWRGLVPHMLYGGIGSAATFIIYEQTVRWSLRD